MEIKSESGEEIPSAPPPPSFFKIMFGDFSTTLLIPPAFVKHLHLLFPQKIVLATTHDGKRWHVTVVKVDNKLYFETGWHKFVQDKSILLGDFLVFSYVNQLEFNVKIFKRTGCEQVDDKAIGKEADSATGNEIQAMHNNNYITGDQIDASGIPRFAAVADTFSSDYPFFKVTLTRTYAGKEGFGHIPRSFSEHHLDLAGKRILLQVSDRTWPARIYQYSGRGPKPILRICTGWRAFARDNSLQAKDVCFFELIEGNTIVMKVNIIRSIPKVRNKRFCSGSIRKL